MADVEEMTGLDVVGLADTNAERVDGADRPVTVVVLDAPGLEPSFRDLWSYRLAEARVTGPR